MIPSSTPADRTTLTFRMREALEHIAATDRDVVDVGGRRGQRHWTVRTANVAPRGEWPRYHRLGFVATRTIEALQRRGLIRVLTPMNTKGLFVVTAKLVEAENV